MFPSDNFSSVVCFLLLTQSYENTRKIHNFHIAVLYIFINKLETKNKAVQGASLFTEQPFHVVLFTT